MCVVANSENILRNVLSTNHSFKREAFIPKPAKVSGVWDATISIVAPRNEVTGNRTLTFLPQGLESLLGEFSYSSLVAANGGLSFNLEKKLLIDKVKKNLLPHVRRTFDWDIQLVSSKEMNACALPGGKIIICEGIIDHMVDYLRLHIDEIQGGLSQRSEKEQAEVLARELESMVAAVIGHEIAHADIGHGRSAIQKTILFYVLIFIAFTLTYFFSQKSIREEKKEVQEKNIKTEPLRNIASFCYDHLFNIGFKLYTLAQSRSAEFEADAMGMQVYMHEAGYDLNGMVRMMDMFVNKKVSCHTDVGLIERITEVFSTHPLSERRKMQAIEIRDRVHRASNGQKNHTL